MFHSTKRAIQKINLSVSKRGTIGTLNLITSRLIYNIKNASPTRRLALKRHDSASRDFDAVYGVNTASPVAQIDLEAQSKNHTFATKYEPTPIYNVDLPQILEKFDLPYEDYTFIDYGSGKGRPLLLASAFPFKKIIGIEFSKKLNIIAKNNISRYTGKKICTDIESICMDATEYVCPVNEPLILYFFHPFENQVMQKVVDNISTSYQNNPRHIIVVYVHPLEQKVWDKVLFFTKKKISKQICIYDTNQHLESNLMIT